MLYDLSKFIWLFLSPLNLIILLFLLYFFLKLINFKNTSKFVLVLIFSFFIIVAILPTGIYLLVKLETKYSNLKKLPEIVDGILILGGPSNPSLTEKYDQVSFNSHGERLTESIKIINKYKSAKVIFSGGSELSGFNNTHSYVAKKFFEEMGIKKNRVIYESKSRNTYENIIFSKKIAKPKSDETWILITSAFHMPRSLNIAKKQKWNFIPYSVDYQTSGDQTNFKITIFKILENINFFDLASHEWVGLISYYILKRSNSIY